MKLSITELRKIIEEVVKKTITTRKVKSIKESYDNQHSSLDKFMDFAERYVKLGEDLQQSLKYILHGDADISPEDIEAIKEVFAGTNDELTDFLDSESENSFDDDGEFNDNQEDDDNFLKHEKIIYKLK